MADIRGIELASDIYGLQDTSARASVDDNTSAIGNLADLKTTAKNNLVSAINELVPPENFSDSVTHKGLAIRFDFRKGVAQFTASGTLTEALLNLEVIYTIANTKYRPISDFQFPIMDYATNTVYGFGQIAADGKVSVYASNLSTIPITVKPAISAVFICA